MRDKKQAILKPGLTKPTWVYRLCNYLYLPEARVPLS